MNSLSTAYSRARRSTAGINKRYNEQEYLLVSFPQLSKHSIVPAASVNVDPLDKQNGSIKTFGSRKNLRIISTGKPSEKHLSYKLKVIISTTRLKRIDEGKSIKICYFGWERRS